MKTCPHCAETDLQDAAIVCKHCHRDIPTAAEIRDRRIAMVALGVLLTVVVLVVGEMAVRLSNPNLRIVEGDSTGAVESPQKR